MKPTNKKFKVLKQNDFDLVEDRIRGVLHASRDALRNRNVDTRRTAFSIHDAYYGEAVGVMIALETLGYGYWGPINIDAVKDHRGSVPHHNLAWWLNQIETRVLQEEGFYGNHVCKYCLERYQKDSTMFNDNKQYNPETNEVKEI